VVRPASSRLKWFISLLLLLLLCLFHAQWMTALGRYLVVAGEPVRADIAVVLAGDGYGHRILKGGEMVRLGFTDRVLVSGPKLFYGRSEADLAIPFAVSHGYPESWFLASPHEGTSTSEEAVALVAELRKLAVRRCLLVTSDYHTRRAGKIFRRAAPEVEFRVVAAPDEFFKPDSWWHTREGQKRFVIEWMKTITAWFGI
jgi:uncharacterized SAM-binding protein YcdF (DUF218 family)